MTGLVAASLFAGVGGSSLGYRAAGWQVAYANEWDEFAADVYALNLETDVDRRDVRDVGGKEILDAVGQHELDLLDGSPPCQPFSSAGRRRGRSDGRDMFPEYVRLVGEVRPRAFVAENVPGLADRPTRPYLAEIIFALRGAGYAVKTRVLWASWLGVPQERKRLYIIGFRDDLGVDPAAAFPKYADRETAIRDALPHVRRIVRIERPTGHLDWRARETWRASRPAPTVEATGLAFSSWSYVRVETVDGDLRKPTPDEVKALQSFPPGFRFPEGASFGRMWKAIGNAVPPPVAGAVGGAVRDALTAAL